MNRKRWKTFKAKLKEVTRKTTPVSFDERIKKLHEIQRGWLNAFKESLIRDRYLPAGRWCERCTGGLLARQPPTRLWAGFISAYKQYLNLNLLQSFSDFLPPT